MGFFGIKVVILVLKYPKPGKGIYGLHFIAIFGKVMKRRVVTIAVSFVLVKIGAVVFDLPEKVVDNASSSSFITMDDDGHGN